MINAVRPIGAITIWSQATRLDNARALTLVEFGRVLSGKRRSRKVFHRPRKGEIMQPKQKNRKVRITS